MYPQRLVARMREELTSIGFDELRTSESVDTALRQTDGTTLLVVNTFCPYAVESRPAVAHALEHSQRPDHLVTVFAGEDPIPTARAREYIIGYGPSSPSFALFKSGKPVFVMERDQILGRSAESVAGDLSAALDRFCSQAT